MNDYAFARKASLDWKELNLVKKLVNCHENFYHVCICVCVCMDMVEIYMYPIYKHIYYFNVYKCIYLI